ncbi:50S ribosomal protein L3 [Candidatus Pacearchaeota archaeon]|nr:50S ribosomal protein L3 [Candidatus Pacearchaeota archaeon]
MAKLSRPRRGSLQFWPRKRAKKLIPSVNWKIVSSQNYDKLILGFIGYKVGMASAYVKDNTPDSMTKSKRIIIPVTIIECPKLKILSTRFYKNGQVMGEVLNKNLNKELIKKIKMPKTISKKIEDYKDYDDIRIVIYTDLKNFIKKNPDIIEISLGGDLQGKLNFIKEHLDKNISVSEFAQQGSLIDIKAVTKGKGLQGPIKRFGAGLRQHKAEKGVRKIGSIGPWHPARVSFRVPMAGQMGFFNRIQYNNSIIYISNISEKNINVPGGFNHFGNINGDYILVSGSVQGPSKRQLVITQPLRPTRKQSKKSYEFIELR